MRKIFTFAFALIVLLHLSDVSLLAQGSHGGHGGGKGPSMSQDRGNAGSHQGPGARSGMPGDHGMQGRPDHGGTSADSRHEKKSDKSGDALAGRYERNPKLAARVESMLPPGTDIRDASSGFKNHGQFMAALHVSKNLNIPFNQLKAKMTGDHSMPMGSAIRDLRPEMSQDQANREAKKAEKQAKEMEKKAKAIS